MGESHYACLLHNHGTITVGESVEEAFTSSVVLEEMAEIYYNARLVGEPILLDRDQVNEVANKISGYGQPREAPPETR
jgi:L-fuculose-phosphate aldolase